MTDNATYQAHKEFEKRQRKREGTPVSPEYQRRADNLNILRDRLQQTRTRALFEMSKLLDEKGSSYLVDNYLSQLVDTDARLNTLARYEWYLLENRVSEL